MVCLSSFFFLLSSFSFLILPFVFLSLFFALSFFLQRYTPGGRDEIKNAKVEDDFIQGRAQTDFSKGGKGGGKAAAKARRGSTLQVNNLLTPI